MTEEDADEVIDALSDVLAQADIELEDACEVLLFLLSHTLHQAAPKYDAAYAESMCAALAAGYRACCSAYEVNANITFQ